MTDKTDKVDKVEETKDNGIQETLRWMKEKIDSQSSELEKLKTEKVQSKGRKFSIVGSGNMVDSEFQDSMAERNRKAEENPEPVILVKEVGFKGFENACPYCNMAKTHNLVDLNPRSGRYSCRKCAKNWSRVHLNKPYDKAIEMDYNGGLIYDETLKKWQRPVAA